MARSFPKAAGYHWDQVTMVVRPDGLPACRWCKGPVRPPRKAWCGNPACQDAWSIRVAGQSGCRTVCQWRDHGVCAACGLDTAAIVAEWAAARQAAQDAFLEAAMLPLIGRHHATIRAARNRIRWSREYVQAGRTFAAGVEFCRRYGPRIWKALKDGGTLWEADHIIEIVDGGDHFDPVNLQTLCLDCHSRKSSISSSRRAGRQSA